MNDLEPRERDPKAIRRTVLILLVIMFGGIIVANSYRKLLSRQNEVFRPNYSERLNKNLQLVRQDRKAISLDDLGGQVWLCALVKTGQPETGKLSREVMVEMSNRFSEESDLKCVLIAADPESDTPAELSEWAESEGLTLPRWWLVGAGAERLGKYLKNEMRFSDVPYEKDGQWKFDTSVVVVDRNRHIRGHFDFDRAVTLQDELPPEDRDALNYREELTERLEMTIQYLLENEQ